jgi:hypothetical protein
MLYSISKRTQVDQDFNTNYFFLHNVHEYQLGIREKIHVTRACQHPDSLYVRQILYDIIVLLIYNDRYIHINNLQYDALKNLDVNCTNFHYYYSFTQNI